MKPRQRLTCVPCQVCGRTTLNWSRLCVQCTKAARGGTIKTAHALAELEEASP